MSIQIYIWNTYMQRYLFKTLSIALKELWKKKAKYIYTSHPPFDMMIDVMTNFTLAQSKKWLEFYFSANWAKATKFSKSSPVLTLTQ
jgi:hypothetical protein